MKKFYYLFLLGGILALSSCGKDDEVVGPQGPAGLDGVLTQGSISGKVNGNRENGDTINESFNFNVYYSLTDSRIYSGDGDRVYVYRGGLDRSNYFEFSFYTNDPTEQPDSSDIDLDFHFVKSLNDGEYLKFGFNNNMWQEAGSNARYFDDYSGDSRLTISNYSYSPATGNLKFDYKIDLTAWENTSGNPATVTGAVNVNLKREVYKSVAKD